MMDLAALTSPKPEIKAVKPGIKADSTPQSLSDPDQEQISPFLKIAFEANDYLIRITKAFKALQGAYKQKDEDSISATMDKTRAVLSSMLNPRAAQSAPIPHPVLPQNTSANAAVPADQSEVFTLSSKPAAPGGREAALSAHQQAVMAAAAILQDPEEDDDSPQTKVQSELSEGSDTEVKCQVIAGDPFSDNTQLSYKTVDFGAMPMTKLSAVRADPAPLNPDLPLPGEEEITALRLKRIRGLSHNPESTAADVPIASDHQPRPESRIQTPKIELKASADESLYPDADADIYSDLIEDNHSIAPAGLYPDHDSLPDPKMHIQVPALPVPEGRLKPDDCYAEVAQHDAWYQDILKAGLNPNSPEYAVFTGSQRIIVPGNPERWIITMEKSAAFITGNADFIPHMQQLFVHGCGRPLILEVHLQNDLPQDSPYAHACMVLKHKIAAARRELGRSRNLRKLFEFLGEDLNSVPIDLYAPPVIKSKS